MIPANYLCSFTLPLLKFLHCSLLCDDRTELISSQSPIFRPQKTSFLVPHHLVMIPLKIIWAYLVLSDGNQKSGLKLLYVRMRMCEFLSFISYFSFCNSQPGHPCTAWSPWLLLMFLMILNGPRRESLLLSRKILFSEFLILLPF